MNLGRRRDEASEGGGTRWRLEAQQRISETSEMMEPKRDGGGRSTCAVQTFMYDQVSPEILWELPCLSVRGLV